MRQNAILRSIEAAFCTCLQCSAVDSSVVDCFRSLQTFTFFAEVVKYIIHFMSKTSNKYRHKRKLVLFTNAPIFKYSGPVIIQVGLYNYGGNKLLE